MASEKIKRRNIYWGNVAKNAKRVARLGSEQEKAAALMMLKLAQEAITGADAMLTSEKTQGGVLQKISGRIGNKNEYNA